MGPFILQLGGKAFFDLDLQFFPSIFERAVLKFIGSPFKTDITAFLISEWFYICYERQHKITFSMLGVRHKCFPFFSLRPIEIHLPE